MDEENSVLSAVHKQQQRRQRKEPEEPLTASSPPLMLPNPYQPQHSPRGSRSGPSPRQNQSNMNGVAAGKGGEVAKRHGYSSVRRVRETNEDFMQRDRPLRDPQTKTSKSNNSTGQRVTGKGSGDTQRKGFRGSKSAPNSAGKSKPAQADLVPFDMKMTDFPELAGGALSKPGPPPAQKECWGPASQTQTSASSWRSGRKGSPTRPDPRQTGTNAKPEPSVSSPGEPVVTSWANVASQPPKKPAPVEKTIGSNHMQTEDVAEHQGDEAPGKKKRKKKKKKAKAADEEAEAESERPAIYQEPPKFEDEEEFPGLTPALTWTEKLITGSNAAKLCSEGSQREGAQQQSANPIKEKSPAEKTQPTENTKKQKAEKVSGKKSKAPVQLDIGNMLATLEKKQQSQKAKQDAKPVILTVGGGLPVVQKQPVVQKKPPWQQDKIAHNPLDSTSPLVKKGKQREVPKAKKPTALKKVILKEREERKQRRLQEERGLLPEEEDKPAEEAAEEEQCEDRATEEVGSPTEELDDPSEIDGTDQIVKEDEEDKVKEEIIEPPTPSPVSVPVNRPKIHSRKFRDYCSQMLSKDVDESVTTLLKELVRFQDRLYQKDPMKARMKRRIVMGLREVLKHLKLRKVKCVIISPNCERIQSKGGLDEALYTIIDTCREQGVPFVFALSRKALGHCVNKAVPVSLVGIFNYDGAQDIYHKMIELSSEARRAYEEMVLSLEQAGPTEEELQIGGLDDEVKPHPDTAQPEEPEYIKIWKKMLEKDCNHTFLNFEEQLSSMCLDSECTENTEDEKS